MKPALVLLPLALAFTVHAQLRSHLEAIAAQAHGRVGIACSLPGTPLDCNVNATAKLPMQSVYKLPIAMATLHAVEAGRLNLADKIAFLPGDMISPGQHSPLRQQYPAAGVQVPLERLLQLAVSESDGVASDILLRTLGGPPVVDAYVKSLGIQGIRIADSEKTIGADIHAQYRNYAEAEALVLLLRSLADDSPLNAQHTWLLLTWMTQTGTGEHRLKGLLPSGTVVAHKTGTSGEDRGVTHATNDTGLITMADGQKLAIAVLIADSPAPEKTREAVIAQVSREIWQAANRTSKTR